MSRRVVRVLLVLIVLAVGGAGVFAWMGRSEPRWYEPPPAHDPVVEALADRVEYRIVEESHRAREESEPWTVRVREGQVNAWLATRLPAWIAHEGSGRWPEALGTPQVRIRPESIAVGIPLRVLEGRVAVVRVRPWLDDQGALRFELRSVGLGRLPVPGDPVVALADLARRHENSAIGATVDLLAGRRSIDPDIRLDDGRLVRLVDLAFHAGAVDVTCRTFPDADSATAEADDDRRELATP